MKWTLNQPLLGDMVRVKVGEIYHYGVYVSDEEIIQFGLAPSARAGVSDQEVCVLTSDVDQFLSGGFLECAELDKKELKKRIKPQKTVEIARSRIGEKGYNILYNNCEHFAYECVTGKKYCSQTDDLRQKFHAMPVLYAFIAEIPPNPIIASVYPKERDAEIAQCKNQRLREQRYYVWKLLEYALKWTFGVDIRDVSFQKTQNGKWTCDKCEFSLSHSEDVVAVAVSRSPVGVDVELIRPPVVEGLERKILSDHETAELEAVTGDKTQFLIEKWTKKESAFKRSGEKNFMPREICDYTKTQSTVIHSADKSYCLSVTADGVDKLRIKSGVKL